MITSIEFTRRDDGLWEGQFPSGYGLLQVDRTKSADRNALHVYSQIEGMKPVRLATTTKNIFSMNLRLAPGMTVIILSEKPVDSCKFVSDETAGGGSSQQVAQQVSNIQTAMEQNQQLDSEQQEQIDRNKAVNDAQQAAIDNAVTADQIAEDWK